MLIRRLESIGHTLAQLQRFREIARVFLKYGHEDLARKLHLTPLLGLKPRPKGDETRHPLTQPQKLRLACEELGPTFIKMGQVLATRPELLPEDYRAELSHLLDHVAPVPFATVRGILEAELHCPLEEIFQFIEEQPLGAASIAQVHRARLCSGEEVVVKVQRPGVRKIVEEDLNILRQLAALMENHVPGWKVHHPTDIVEQLARTLAREIDFTIEASHLERFAWQFEGDPTLHLPQVHRELTTATVLTMEYVDGMKASDYARSGASQQARREVARRIASSVMQQIFVHGFFHADPHPGNIHVLPGQVICFLDFGMMGFVDLRGREAFADLVWGIARKNESTVTRALLQLAHAEHQAQRHGLEAEVADFMHQHFYRPLGEVEYGRVIGQLLQLLARHELRIHGDFYILLKALSLMEDLVRGLDPQFNLVQEAQPVLRRVRLSRIAPNRLSSGLLELGQDLAELARGLPADLRHIVAQIKNGQAKLVFRHDGLEPILHAWDQASNRLSYAIVLAALIIGSSVIVHANIPPQWNGLPVIGLAGFIVAGLMGFGLLLSILRHGKM